MTLFRSIFPYWVFIFFIGSELFSQPTASTIDPIHSVYLIGNTTNCTPQDPVFKNLRGSLKASSSPTTLIFLGDLVNNPKIADSKSQLLEELKQVANDNKNGKSYALTGDRDWDNNGVNGLKNVNQLQKDLKESKLKILPKDGCPGPISVELDESTVLVLISSQWYMHPHDRPYAPDTDCRSLTEFDFWEELKDHLEDAKGKNILLAAHHPVYSNGKHAGKNLGKYHAIPIIGTFYVSYRQQVGNPSDMAYPAYRDYNFHLQEILRDFPSVIYVSGHEENQQIRQIENDFHLNNGDANSAGFLKLEYFEDGEILLKSFSPNSQEFTKKQRLFYSPCLPGNIEANVNILTNKAFTPCAKENINNTVSNQKETKKTGETVAGKEYAASNFQRFLMGKGYRKEWTQPIQVPYLDLDKMHGGLTPYATGGGLQTNSLKFTGADKKQYAFRSINKDPVRGLDDLTKQTVYRNIVKDLITTQHPYGGLVASSLLDATDILHSRPTLYLMPDNPRLDSYQSFANTLGTLEYRPGSAEKKEDEIGEADDIDPSNTMFRSLYKDNDNRVDPTSYARARMFDLFVGDWDRHEDNWKWAQYKKKKSNTFKPIPRDRDHVFSQWSGLIPGLADKFIPNAENFGMDFNNIQQLTFKARHLDRQLGSSLTLKDWKDAANYIQQKMTPEVITKAINVLPKEIKEISGPTISEKLKNRLPQLEEAATKLYQLLSKEVDIVGSNKREIFEIKRLENGDVKVQLYGRKKKSGDKGQLVYNRTFKKGETKEIRVFGLGGKDEFYLTGQGKNKSILVRVIGGKGSDKIEDQSKANGLKKYTQIYDSEREDLITKGSETKIRRPTQVARYNNKSFEYSYLAPLPKFRISSGNGFGAEFLLTYHKLGFNKPDYHQKFQAKLLLYTIDAQRLDLKNWHRHVIGKWDLLLHARLSSLYDKFPFFYGIGNATLRDEDLHEDEYYRTDFNTVQFSSSLIREFWQKSEFNIGLRYEFNDVNPKNETRSIFFEEKYLDIDGTQKQHLLGFITSLDIDFRDNPIFSKRGSQFYIQHEMFNNFGEGDQFFGKVEGHLAHYMTAGFATVALRGGFSAAYGNPPFYHLAAMGSNTYLRAYFRNRFLGDRAASLSTDLRLHLKTIRTPLFPIKWGIYGFYDLGRVWSDDEGVDIGRFHQAYGGGIYAAPLKENFAFTFTVGNPDREDDLYFRVSLGFDLQ